MGEERLKFVERVRARGQDYYYFRRHGMRTPLPGKPGEARFHERYAELLENSKVVRVKAPAGSLKALIETYKASPEFKQLAATTQVGYSLMLDRMEPVARFQVRDIRRKHLRALRDQWSHKARTANELIKVAKLLFARAVADEDIETNPASDIEALKTGKSYKRWSVAQMKTFEDAYLAGAVPQWAMTAYMLARYTSHSRAEVLQMNRTQYDGQILDFSRGKTDAELLIPVHRHLKTYLDSLPKETFLYVTTPDGRPWDKRNFSKAWRALLDGLGLKGLHLHGLRHTAAQELAESGASDREIMAVTGHKSAASVQVYTQRAEQRKRAANAIKKMERNRRRT
jgi:integrase